MESFRPEVLRAHLSMRLPLTVLGIVPDARSTAQPVAKRRPTQTVSMSRSVNCFTRRMCASSQNGDAMLERFIVAETNANAGSPRRAQPVCRPTDRSSGEAAPAAPSRIPSGRPGSNHQRLSEAPGVNPTTRLTVNHTVPKGENGSLAASAWGVP